MRCKHCDSSPLQSFDVFGGPEAKSMTFDSARRAAMCSAAFFNSIWIIRTVRLCRTAISPDERFSTHAALKMARSEEHTSELQSLMRISYAVFCLKKKTRRHTTTY